MPKKIFPETIGHLDLALFLLKKYENAKRVKIEFENVTKNGIIYAPLKSIEVERFDKKIVGIENDKT